MLPCSPMWHRARCQFHAVSKRPKQAAFFFTQHAFKSTCLVALALLTTALSSHSNAMPYSDPYHQPQFEWHHRAIFYFTPAYDDLVDQLELEALMHHCYLRELDVIVLIIKKDGQTKPDWIGHAFDIRTLHRYFEIDTDRHTAVLVGKDGMEKSRWHDSVDWPDMRYVINQTPSRQAELRAAPYLRGRCEM
ncbi:DUF4174 domain-containing protein [Vibrio sp. SM6]|uniref:DUF4174 domain-containing protein n=1 Tax=Vibrio agarilyticus TaxID=2726741 RepID=A0A7X8TTF5_9VIBR|nr:DUF4174 domain-containing protein [Vibrio agarilyticus]NLS14577.1 DUF4174 domain-containing protein [Vibrio agarilyticus]